MSEEELEKVKEIIKRLYAGTGVTIGDILDTAPWLDKLVNEVEKLQKEKTYYVAVDIGCIECGEESTILGIFDTKEQAEKVCKENEKIQNDNWVGEHQFYVDIIKEINKEYSPYKENDNDIEGE